MKKPYISRKETIFLFIETTDLYNVYYSTMTTSPTPFCAFLIKILLLCHHNDQTSSCVYFHPL